MTDVHCNVVFVPCGHIAYCRCRTFDCVAESSDFCTICEYIAEHPKADAYLAHVDRIRSSAFPRYRKIVEAYDSYQEIPR